VISIAITGDFYHPYQSIPKVEQFTAHAEKRHRIPSSFKAFWEQLYKLSIKTGAMKNIIPLLWAMPTGRFAKGFPGKKHHKIP
jgi:hypothetical protein